MYPIHVAHIVKVSWGKVCIFFFIIKNVSFKYFFNHLLYICNQISIHMYVHRNVCGVAKVVKVLKGLQCIQIKIIFE